MKTRSSCRSLDTGKQIRFSAVLTPDFFRLLFPLVFQCVLTTLINATDSVMLGRLSQDALSAISLACQLSQIFNMYTCALGVGAAALQAQYFGNKDTDSVRRVNTVALQFSVAGGLLFFILSCFFPQTVMRLFTDDPSLIGLGSLYLRPVSFSYLFLSVSQIYLGAMKNTGSARPSAIFGTVSVVLNIILDYLLIFGSFGLPQLGVQGAAVATTISRGAELLLVVIFVLKSKTLRSGSIPGFFRPYRGMTRKLLRFCVPSMIQMCSWMIGSALTMAILGHMGSDVVAAASVAVILLNLFASVISGVAGTVGIVLGQILGRGEVEKARRTGDILMTFSVLVGIAVCLLLLFIGPVIVPVFNTLTDKALQYIRFMILFSGLKCIARGINSPLACGVFSAGGDVRYLMKTDIITMWAFILPLSALAAFVFRLSPILVFFVIHLDEAAKLYHMIRRYRTYIWAKNLTKKDWAQPGRYDRQIRHQIIEEMPLGVMVISSSGRIVLVNKACAALMGMDIGEIEGSNYRTLFLTENGGNEALSDLFIEAMSDRSSPRETDILYQNRYVCRKLHVRASYMEDEDCRIGLCIMLSAVE